MVAMMVTALVSCYFYFSSPGNQARLGGNPLGGNVLFSVISSFKKFGVLAYDWVLKGPLLFFTVLWLVILSRLSKGARNYFSIPAWFAILLFIGVVTAQLFPSYYGVGIEPTPRVINCVYFFFLIGWFYVMGVIFHNFNLSETRIFDISRTRYAVIYCITILSVALSFYRSNNVRIMYTDIIKGRAAAFDKENYERYELLKNSREKVVYLPALKIRPSSLYVDDITLNQKHWWNKCLAGYYGKEAVIMVNEHVE